MKALQGVLHEVDHLEQTLLNVRASRATDTCLFMALSLALGRLQSIRTLIVQRPADADGRG